ncbi:hypothetical protein ACJX0J_038839, partial [Zea mays]
ILDARAIKNIPLVFLSIKFPENVSLLAIIKPNTFLALNIVWKFLSKLPKQSWQAQKICTFVIKKAYIEILFFEVYIGGKGMPTSSMIHVASPIYRMKEVRTNWQMA